MRGVKNFLPVSGRDVDAMVLGWDLNGCSASGMVSEWMFSWSMDDGVCVDLVMDGTWHMDPLKLGRGPGGRFPWKGGFPAA